MAALAATACERNPPSKLLYHRAAAEAKTEGPCTPTAGCGKIVPETEGYRMNETTHFRVGAKELRQAVRVAKRFVPRKTSLQILTCMALEARDGALTITANDLVTSIRLVVPAEVMRTGTVVLPARELAKVLQGSYGGSIEIEGDDRHCASIEATHPKGPCCTLHGLPAEEWPRAIRELGPTSADLEFSAADLRRGLEFVAAATVPKPFDTQRDWGASILIDKSEDGLAVDFVATEGQRLHHVGLCPTVNRIEITARDRLLPADVMQEFVRLLGSDGPAKIAIGAAAGDEPDEVLLARLEYGNVVIMTRLREGRYVNWRRVVPSSPRPNAATVRRADLAAALSKVEEVAADDANKVSILPAASHGLIQVLARSQVLGHAGAEVLAEMEGEFGEHWGRCNRRYLADVAEHADAEDLRIEITRGGSLDTPYAIHEPVRGMASVAVVMPCTGTDTRAELEPDGNNLDAARERAEELRAATDRPKPKKRRSRTKELEARIQELEAANSSLRAEIEAMRARQDAPRPKSPDLAVA
ncbi:MAG: hypothetical protein GF320_14195 [Armatimonadia bacterium]|nr:hypothetical protein [Armatimonadia bacterium]